MNTNQYPSILTQSSKVTIKGKKISPSTQVQVSGRDKTPPNKIFVKKVQEKPSPPKYQKNLTQMPKSKKPPKVPAPQIAQTSATKVLKKSSTLKKQSLKPTSKTSELKDPEKSASGPSLLKPKLKTIIKSSLKKEKLMRNLKEKEKKAQREKKEQKKIELNIQNNQIRIENTKWKKVKLRHKCEWGMDQSRVNVREHSSERPTSRKAKSTERVRGYAENIREYLADQGKSFTHNRTLSHGSENSGPLKPKYYKNPKILEYMKNKKIEIKQQQELENLQKVAQDMSKVSKLNRLELIRKALKCKNKVKKVKKAKTSRKSKENSGLDSDDRPKDIYKLNLVYEPSKLNDFSEADSSRELNSINTSRKYPGYLTERSMIPAPPLKNDLKNQAAIKIQSHIRRFLVQCRLNKEESSLSADEIVKEILEHKNFTDSSEDMPELLRMPGKKTLEIVIPSDSSELSDLDKSERGIISEDFEFYDESEGSDNEKFREKNKKTEENPKVEEKLAKADNESLDKNELKERIVTMEAQLQTLEYLKQKEINDLQNITEKTGMNSEIGQLLGEIIVKRYSQLSSLLEGSIHDAKDDFFNRLNNEEKESFYSELGNKFETMTKFIDSEGEKIGKITEKIVKQSKFDKKLSIPVKSQQNISCEEPVDTPQFSAIFSPQAKFSPTDEGSLDNLSVEEEEPKEFSTLIIEDFQVSSATQSQNISNLSVISPKNYDKIYKNISVLQANVAEYGEVLQDFENEGNDKSYTPDYLPERPSAPLNYFDSESQSPDTNPSPSVSKIQHSQYEDSSCIEWIPSMQIEITPELVSELAENIILDIIDEHEAFNSDNWDVLKIQTDPESVLTYSENIYKFCNINQILESVQKPREKNPLSVLQQIHENLFDTSNTLAPLPENLNLNLYLYLENNIDQTKKTDRPIYVSDEVHSWLIEAEHIHNKLIFDANNEALEKFRPSDLRTLPLPFSWHLQKPKKHQKILENVLMAVANWSEFKVGKIYSSEMVNSSVVIDDEMFQQIRENNLAKMLISEIIESDCEWNNFEFEEIQTKIDLADDVVEFLSQELVNILNQ